MTDAAQVIACLVVLAATFALGYRRGYQAGSSTRIVPLRPGAKRKPPLRMAKRRPRG